MPGMEYDNEKDINFQSRNNLNVYQKTGLIGFLINRGIVKDEKGAQIVLIIVIIICLGAVAFMLTDGFGITSSTDSQKLSDEQIQQLPPEFREFYQ